MPTAALPDRTSPNVHPASPSEPVRARVPAFLGVAADRAAWNWAAYAGLLALLAFWGREMYVPAALAEGKMFYRDVWYLYGPAGPYISLFFRAFGTHLSVLYWAVSLSVLGCAVLLYSAALRFSSWMRHQGSVAARLAAHGAASRRVGNAGPLGRLRAALWRQQIEFADSGCARALPRTHSRADEDEPGLRKRSAHDTHLLARVGPPERIALLPFLWEADPCVCVKS